MKRFLTVCFSLLILGGCAAHQPSTGFYYGDYANTLYELKKEPSDATRAAHISQLEYIIDYAGKHESIKVPPGIHAELGQRLLKQGESEEAVKHFEAEKSLYPESEKLMTRMIEMSQPESKG
ncbi:DUF4810 domain-containing protein [Marinobacteraceae bacterium S3BR75-40.1]